MHKRKYFNILLLMIMFMYLIIAGGCGGGGGGNGSPAPTRLSGLQLSVGALTPAFSPSITQYTANVANDVTSITITTATTSQNASITVNGANVTGGSATVNLNVGPNVITIVVSNSNGSTTYTLTVTRADVTPEPIPTLSDLQLSVGALTPAFSAATLQYTANVANTATSMTVTPTATANATITVNGANVASGSASGAINLNVGSNAITIVVSNSAGQTTYTVTVTRDNAAPVPIPTLSNLQLSAGTLTPAFSAATLQYTASVANSVTSVTVTPTTTANASITVNGTVVASGSVSSAINLNVGSNAITIVVSNSAGQTTYTVTVTRAAPDPIATLSNLQLSTGTLTPAFSAATTQYTASVANTVTTMTVTPTTTSANATITVNGSVVASGNASSAINLSVGSNAITIVVSNSAGQTTYTVTVTRAATPDPIATLSNLQLSVGTLVPAFSAATLQYTAGVANSVASITVTPTTTSANASITVNGSVVASGSASGAINLNVGPNVITIVAGNSTGSTTYTVTVTRDIPSNAVYHKITQQQAMLEMSQTSGYIILDVRTDSEYAEKHIKNPNTGQEAYLIPHTEVNARAAAELPNKAQFIYVYCKAGVRSEMAARDLVDLGYTNVYDFGGLDDWPYDIWTVGDPPPTTWADMADEDWYRSNPSASNYTISTPEQFAAICSIYLSDKQDFAGKTITLTSDIDLTGFGWSMIVLFAGVFDGGNHTISNMAIESHETEISLIGTLAATGTIKNFNFKDAEIIVCPA